MAENPSVENLTKNFIIGLESYQPKCRETVPIKNQAKVYKFHCGKCEKCLWGNNQKGYTPIVCFHGHYLQSINCSKRIPCLKSPCTKSSPCTRIYYASNCQFGCKLFPGSDEIKVDWIKTESVLFEKKDKSE